MKKEYIIAKPLARHSFSSKWYTIHVVLYEYGMARARISYKKRKGLHNRYFYWASDYLCFDEARRECVYDLYECLDYLKTDKVARRWFRRTLLPCYEKYLLPNGDISTDLAHEDENELFHSWGVYFDGPIDLDIFGRDDILRDPRTKNRTIYFHDKPDDLKHLDFQSEYTHTKPALTLHLDTSAMLEIIRRESPDFYANLESRGLENIETFAIFCNPHKDHPTRYACNIHVYFYGPPIPSVPHDDSPEDEAFLWWNFPKYRKRRRRK